MQTLPNGKYLYSPVDLVNFLGCRHATFLDVQSLNQNWETTPASATDELLQQKGLEHELAYLQQLKDSGYDVAEIPKDEGLHRRTQMTQQAMEAGADVIYQAVLYDPPWRGDADFLMKTEARSRLGNYSYEAVDTKLTRTPEAKHLIQLCSYTDLLTNLQGKRPEWMYLVLGNGEKLPYQVADFIFYYQRAKQRFEDYLHDLPSASYPEPCNHCAICHWQNHCTAQWEQDDHLSRVANIQRSQIVKLQQAGITTVAELANTLPETKIPDLNPEVFQRLQAQAALQHHKDQTGESTYEILSASPGKGFERMPKPDAGDLFFDMEGDPLYPDGLEYLFGVYYQDNGEATFQPFWAHDHTEEKQTFNAFMAFLDAHLKQHPHAHIYHYNHYETTALKRLAGRYGVCEEQLDNLLRGQKFVDLYVVVRESLRISEPGYSIKNLETFYMEKRDGEVATATDSIVMYHRWRETGDNQLLQHIADYNKDDCISTQKLRDWLLQLRPENTPWLNQPEELTEQDQERDRKSWEIEHEDYQARLGIHQENPSPLHTRLSHLLEFHQREAKPQWWQLFHHQTQFEDELIADAECLAGLVKTEDPYPEKQSYIYTYTFPAQDTKLKEGDKPFIIGTNDDKSTITELDETNCVVKLKRGKKQDPPPERLSLGPPAPIDAKPLRSAIYRYADQILTNPDQPHPATDLLKRDRPQIQGQWEEEPIINGNDLIPEALNAIVNLDHSYLFIQGPPGTGKTYLSSHLIVALIQQGYKIGVASNSHKAIHNLLKRVETVAAEQEVDFQGCKKGSKNNAGSHFPGTFIKTVNSHKEINWDAHLFAGTAWCFANEQFQGQLDYLFIDEAGQVAIANVVAMANATRNIILVGDQMQLGQPIQGTHPGEAGLSILAFLLQHRATIPTNQGIFLPETRRLHPNICHFISEAFYEGRLTAHESTKARQLDLQNTDLPNAGIVMLPAHHDGCGQKSLVEGEIIQGKYQQLLGQTITETDGTIRDITANDILIVTPYNVQVNYLRSLLPEEARIGTVDKFQGQEAPITLISMVTSSAEHLPRNIEFLYSPNRLNVALSRAQCLAVVVANPKLLEIPCQTVEQLQLVNVFCWLDVVTYSLR